MTNSQIARNCHYVSQYYLRHFNNENNRIARYDCTRKKMVRSTSSKKICSEQDYFNYFDDAGKIDGSYEEMYARIEDIEAPKIKSFLDGNYDFSTVFSDSRGTIVYGDQVHAICSLVSRLFVVNPNMLPIVTTENREKTLYTQALCSSMMRDHMGSCRMMAFRTKEGLCTSNSIFLHNDDKSYSLALSPNVMLNIFYEQEVAFPHILVTDFINQPVMDRFIRSWNDSLIPHSDYLYGKEIIL